MVLSRHFIAVLGLLGLLSACLPGMSPSGTPSNPADVANSEKSDSGDGDVPSGAAGGDSTAPIPISNPINNPPSGGGSPGDSYVLAQGGTFSPKGDGEAVGGDQQKEATDWRLRFGVNAWWELSRTTPDTYPVFKNTTTDFKMKLEFKSLDSGQWVLAGPTPNGTPVVHMVYQPKGQPPSAAQTFDAAAGWAQPEGYNVAFLNLTLGEGTVTFTVDYVGVTHPLGSFTTYYSDVDASTTSAPALY